MIRVQFESRVLAILDQIVKHLPVEDSQVEVKSQWIVPVRAARQLAGHANAASGAPVLWIVGADEKAATVVGAPSVELASWFAQVEKEFVEVSPAMLDQLVVPNPNGPPVVAMLFDTSRAPYAVRIPKLSEEGHNRAEVEFPWRAGNRTRSARRSELLTVLAGNRLVPDVEELESWLGVEEETLSLEDRPVEVDRWQLECAAYFTPRDDRPVTLPFHQCKAVAEFESGLRVPFSDIRIGPELVPGPFMYPAVTSPATIPSPPQRKESEAYLPSPSKLILRGQVLVEAGAIPEGSVLIRADLGVAGARAILSLAWSLTPRPAQRPYTSQWVGAAATIRTSDTPDD